MEKNVKYYEGYEGEPEIVLAIGNDKEYRVMMSIWNGYFETLLDCMFDIAKKIEGILVYYSNHEGWYDENPWIVENTTLLVQQLINVQTYLRAVNNPSDMQKDILLLTSDLIKVLEDAQAKNERVYFLYD